MMDLQAVISVSMLSVSRSRAAAAFKDFRQQPELIAAVDPLEAVLAACGIPDRSWSELMSAARTRAAAALEKAGESVGEPIPIVDTRYPALLTCIPDPPPVLEARPRAAHLLRPLAEYEAAIGGGF